MSAHADTQEHFAGSNKLFLSIWTWLLLLTGFEVFLGYVQLPVIYMLVILMGASIVKAALIVAYFMHWRCAFWWFPAWICSPSERRRRPLRLQARLRQARRIWNQHMSRRWKKCTLP